MASLWLTMVIRLSYNNRLF